MIITVLYRDHNMEANFRPCRRTPILYTLCTHSNIIHRSSSYIWYIGKKQFTWIYDACNKKNKFKKAKTYTSRTKRKMYIIKLCYLGITRMYIIYVIYKYLSAQTFECGDLCIIFFFFLEIVQCVLMIYWYRIGVPFCVRNIYIIILI